MIRPIHQSHRTGLTLTELLLSLTITGMIGAGIAAMLFSMSHSVDRDRQQRSAVVKLRVLDTRLGTAFRTAQSVLDFGDDYVVLWTGDSRANGTPNLSELRRIEWNADSDTLWVYTGRADLEEDADTAYDTDSDFNAITTSLIGSSAFPGQAWTDGMTAWSMRLDDEADPRQANMVQYTMTVDYDSHSESCNSVATLRTE